MPKLTFRLSETVAYGATPNIRLSEETALFKSAKFEGLVQMRS